MSRRNGRSNLRYFWNEAFHGRFPLSPRVSRGFFSELLIIPACLSREKNRVTLESKDTKD